MGELANDAEGVCEKSEAVQPRQYDVVCLRGTECGTGKVLVAVFVVLKDGPGERFVTVGGVVEAAMRALEGEQPGERIREGFRKECTKYWIRALDHAGVNVLYDGRGPVGVSRFAELIV